MTISVLMSVYKSERPAFMDRALRSVWIEQTLKPDQIVLVEDGPLGEDLQKVIDGWKERLGEKLVLHQNSENLGLTKSLNIGLQYVTSDLVARMDSDDISHPRRLEHQVRFLEQHKNIYLVGGAIQEFNHKEKCLNIRRYPLTDDAIRAYIGKASPFAHPAVMIRSSLFKAGFKYNEKYRTSQDIALWFDLLIANYKMANVDEVILYFRRDDAMFRRRSKSNAINEFKIYCKGIYHLYGIVSLKYIYPLFRLCFRFIPICVVKWIYGSRLRNYILQ